MASGFPELWDTRGFSRGLDAAFNGLVATWGETLEALFMPVLRLLGLMEKGLQALPWWLVALALAALAWHAARHVRTVAGGLGLTLALAALAWHAARNWRTVAVVLALTLALGLIGVWDAAMATIALMLMATALSILAGIPIGVLMSRVDRLRVAALPVLDIMQTMPIFVYLIPFVMLFGPGKIPALLATIVFAIPPVIRLTDLGIRQVDPEIVEASRAFGASPGQQLWTVQVPLALPAIMAGVNQTTMMALSMVVI